MYSATQHITRRLLSNIGFPFFERFPLGSSRKALEHYCFCRIFFGEPVPTSPENAPIDVSS